MTSKYPVVLSASKTSAWLAALCSASDAGEVRHRDDCLFVVGSEADDAEIPGEIVQQGVDGDDGVTCLEGAGGRSRQEREDLGSDRWRKLGFPTCLDEGLSRKRVWFADGETN